MVNMVSLWVRWVDVFRKLKPSWNSVILRRSISRQFPGPDAAQRSLGGASLAWLAIKASAARGLLRKFNKGNVRGMQCAKRIAHNVNAKF